MPFSTSYPMGFRRLVVEEMEVLEVLKLGPNIALDFSNVKLNSSMVHAAKKLVAGAVTAKIIKTGNASVWGFLNVGQTLYAKNVQTNSLVVRDAIEGDLVIRGNLAIQGNVTWPSSPEVVFPNTVYANVVLANHYVLAANGYFTGVVDTDSLLVENVARVRILEIVESLVANYAVVRGNLDVYGNLNLLGNVTNTLVQDVVVSNVYASFDVAQVNAQTINVQALRADDYVSAGNGFFDVSVDTDTLYVRDIHITGDIYKNGVLYYAGGGGAGNVIGSAGLWSNVGNHAYYAAGNVCIGAARAAAATLEVSSSAAAVLVNSTTPSGGRILDVRRSGAPALVVANVGGAAGLAYTGLGKSDPQHRLDVLGNINFSGVLLRNGAPFGWLEDANDNLYQPTGTVSIGKSAASATLDVLSGGTSITPTLRVDHNNSTSVVAEFLSRQNTIMRIQPWRVDCTAAVHVQTATTSGPALVLQQKTVGQPLLTVYDASFTNLASMLYNGYLGLGVSTPMHQLDVDGNINITGDILKNGVPYVSPSAGAGVSVWQLGVNGSIYYGTGFVGVNTSNPTERLHVVGTAKADNFVGDGAQIINLDMNNASLGVLGVPHGGTGAVSLADGKLLVGSGVGPVHAPVNLHWDKTNSLLGINTTAPQHPLDVVGRVRASEFEGDGTFLTNLNVASVYNTLAVRSGGTGRATLAASKFLVGNGTGEVLTPAEVSWDAATTRLVVSGTTQSAEFVGGGAGITGLTAASISTGVLPVAHGGTGAAALAPDKLLVGGTTAVVAAADLTWAGGVLAVNGKMHAQLHAANVTEGVLAVAHGGTGAATLEPDGVLVGAGTGAVHGAQGLHWRGNVLTLSGNAGVAAYALDVQSGGIFSAGNIYSAQNVVAFSDARLKSNIEPVRGALDMVAAIGGYTYTMHGRPGMGFLAQEVERVAPQVVHETEDGVKGISYGNFSAVLAQAIKELFCVPLPDPQRSENFSDGQVLVVERGGGGGGLLGLARESASRRVRGIVRGGALRTRGECHALVMNDSGEPISLEVGDLLETTAERAGRLRRQASGDGVVRASTVARLLEDIDLMRAGEERMARVRLSLG